jgi:hypothetical protein
MALHQEPYSTSRRTPHFCAVTGANRVGKIDAIERTIFKVDGDWSHSVHMDHAIGQSAASRPLPLRSRSIERETPLRAAGANRLSVQNT